MRFFLAFGDCAFFEIRNVRLNLHYKYQIILDYYKFK